MRSMRSRLIASLGALIVLACAVPKAPPLPTPRAPVEVNAAFGKTWNAVVDFLADNRIVVRTIDRESGLIVAEPVRYEYKRGEQLPADCGNNIYGAVSPSEGTYSIIVRGDDVRSTVRADVRFRYIDPDPEDTLSGSFDIDPDPEDTLSGSFDCSSTGIWERRLTDSVAARATRSPERNGVPLHSGSAGPSFR
jgi:hypothetical protein